VATHTTEQYLSQAAANADLATFLRDNRPNDLDWAVTCLFYSAVHYVNAYLCKTGQGIPRRHRGDQNSMGRSNIVQQDPNLKIIYSDYRALDDDSRDARYELCKPKKSEYDAGKVRLFRIRQHITSKVSDA
jgi:hypothetical protein